MPWEEGKDVGGSREKEGEIPKTGGGLLEDWMEDKVYASRGGQHGFARHSLSKAYSKLSVYTYIYIYIYIYTLIGHFIRYTCSIAW